MELPVHRPRRAPPDHGHRDEEQDRRLLRDHEGRAGRPDGEQAHLPRVRRRRARVGRLLRALGHRPHRHVFCQRGGRGRAGVRVQQARLGRLLDILLLHPEHVLGHLLLPQHQPDHRGRDRVWLVFQYRRLQQLLGQGPALGLRRPRWRQRVRQRDAGGGGLPPKQDWELLARLVRDAQPHRLGADVRGPLPARRAPRLHEVRPHRPYVHGHELLPGRL
mmetsp:Transcript_12192/g.31320  ORF Transcript_12192/g.31320 Transcript_12192/m.31320 type:complete len:219 (-) Transcript_12192:877-1533(-)